MPKNPFGLGKTPPEEKKVLVFSVFAETPPPIWQKVKKKSFFMPPLILTMCLIHQHQKFTLGGVQLNIFKKSNIGANTNMRCFCKTISKIELNAKAARHRWEIDNKLKLVWYFRLIPVRHSLILQIDIIRLRSGSGQLTRPPGPKSWQPEFQLLLLRIYFHQKS